MESSPTGESPATLAFVRAAVQRQAIVEAVNEAWGLLAVLTLAGALAVLFIRIANDIEENLASYVAVVTVINLALGTIVAAGAWLLGLPSPLILGLLAMLLNYIPYVGPTCMAFILLAIGFATFSSLTQALVAPAALIVLCTLEGHLVTPAVLGNRLTLNPLLVFLAIAFWSWLWGPIGAFLAVPLLIVAMVIIDHLFPSFDSRLPG